MEKAPDTRWPFAFWSPYAAQRITRAVVGLAELPYSARTMTEPQSTMTFTAVFEPAEEGGYIAFVEELPGANTQGETLEEARENLAEAVALILEANREAAEREIAGRVVIREPLRVTA